MLDYVRKLFSKNDPAPKADAMVLEPVIIRLKTRETSTIANRLVAAMRTNPGRTARELARLLGYDAQQRVHMDLLSLLDAGTIRREGAGGPGDPHRYFVVN